MLRIIAGAHQRTHCAPLFSELGILSVTQLSKYKIGLFMHKYVNDMLPPVFNMFTRNSDIYSHNTRHQNLLHMPKVRTEFGKTHLIIKR